MESKDPQVALYVPTPLIHSPRLSQLTGAPVYLKLEAFQPSGSFKDRGFARLCSQLKAEGVKRLISSSGGNAGHSVAHVGRKLGIEVLVVVPETTKAIMLDRIRAQGAQVKVHGVNWNAADVLARELVAQDETAQYIPPYDHPVMWEGISTVVDEILASDVNPGAIVVSVGGGGLICGIYEGLKKAGRNDITVIAAETDGAASFARAFEAGHPVRLTAIESIATSLGALEVTAGAIERSSKQPTIVKTVTDREAVESCASFLDDHRILVEPACGAALAVAYSANHRACLQKLASAPPPPPPPPSLTSRSTSTSTTAVSLPAASSVVIVVCGGSGVTRELLQQWLDTV